MAGDWLKLHRCIRDSAVFNDDWLTRLWIWCLISANYSDRPFKGQTIERGQFVTGRKSGAKELGVDESKFYRGLQRLEKLESIRLKSNTSFTVVTVSIYETYQNGENETEQQVNSQRTTNEQRLNNDRTADEQPVNTSKEGKKERREEGKKDLVPAAQRKPNQKPKGKPETWLTEYGDVWMECFGGLMPYDRYAKDLKALEKAHTRVTVLERWKNYCDANRGRGEFASSAKFSQTFGQWSDDPQFQKSDDDPRGTYSAANAYLANKGIKEGIT